MTSAKVAGRPATVALLVHPSPDLYGSDRQLIETVDGLREAGYRVRVLLPTPGPLEPLLVAHGAEVEISAFPVLRKALLSPRGLFFLAISLPGALIRSMRILGRPSPTIVYVNTMTIPLWLLAARLRRIDVVCHVHEAEDDQPKLLRAALAAPLLLASSIVVNSAASRASLVGAIGRLGRRVIIIYNGVSGPPEPAAPPPSRMAGDPAHIVLVGRLSPRKGIDVALEAVAVLRAQGRQVTLTVCGSAFSGYEWYEESLRRRAGEPDLAGGVTFAGYLHPTWDQLAAADIVIVPSRAEPFGNAAVEGLLARRPVVGSNVQGLAEVIDDGRTGILVAGDDAAALADGIAELLDDPARATGLADAGVIDANRRFSIGRYRHEIVQACRRPRGSAQ